MQLKSKTWIGYSFPHLGLIHFKYDLFCNVTIMTVSNLKIRNVVKFYCHLNPTFLNFLNDHVNHQLFWRI